MNKLAKDFLGGSTTRRRREGRDDEAPPPPYHPSGHPEAGPSTSTTLTNGSGASTTESSTMASGASSADFAFLLLGNSDRLTAVGLPQSMITPLGDAIVRGWPTGVQRGGEVADVPNRGWEWKLRGLPWREHVAARRLLCSLLAALYAGGWHVQATSNLSKGILSKDTLFLRAGPGQQRTFFAISFNDQDRLRLIDPPSDEVRSAFVRVGRTWHKGLQDVKEKDAACVDLRLRGFPFHTHMKAEQTLARALLLDVIGVFNDLGYELICCVEMPTMPTDAGDEPESWFFASKPTNE